MTRKKKLRIVLLVIVLLATVGFILFRIAMRDIPPFDDSDLVTEYEDIPDEENALTYFNRAADLFLADETEYKSFIEQASSLTEYDPEICRKFIEKYSRAFETFEAGLKCHKCQFDNPPDAVFCQKCGTKFLFSDETLAPTKSFVDQKSIPEKIVAGKYRLIQELGRGGMGIVYKAEDVKLKRSVALKFLPQELTRDMEARERFIHEAQAASQLDHSNICTVHEIDVDLYGGTRHSTATALGKICTPEEVQDATGHASKAFQRYFQNKQARALKVTSKIKELQGDIIRLEDSPTQRRQNKIP